MFEIEELTGMKRDQEGDYFAVRQSKWTVSSFLLCLFRQNMAELDFLEFDAKIIINAEIIDT